MMADPAVAAEFAHEGSEITRELAIALTLADDPITGLKGKLGVAKRVAWAEPLPLEDVKTLGKALFCTVNDVLLACAAGAIRGYLRDNGEDVDGLVIRATVPVKAGPGSASNEIVAASPTSAHTRRSDRPRGGVVLTTTA